MKKIIRTIGIILLLALWLPSCGREPVLQEGDAVGETAEPVIALTLDGSYVIVRPEMAGSTLTEAASDLRRALSEATGATVKISDDWLAPGKSPAPNEILVGSTNRADSLSLPEEDWRVYTENGQLRIEGGSEAAVAAAVAAFIDGWLGETPTLALQAGELIAHAGAYAVKDITIGGMSVGSCTINVPIGWPAYLEEVWLLEANRLAEGLSALCGRAPAVERGEAAGGGAIRFGHPDDDPLTWSITADGFAAGSTTAITRAVDALLDAAAKQAKKTPDGFSFESLALTGDVSDILTVERTEGTDLRVMNSNILWKPPANARLSTSARMAVIAEAFALYAPDIFTLQEMEAGIKKILLPILTTDNARYALVPSDKWQDIVYDQTKMKLVDSGYEYFAPYEQSKGFLWAVFELTAGEHTGKRFIVTSAHYVLNPEEDESQGPVLRGENSLQKLEKIDALRKTYGCGAIAGGDYFASKGAPAYENMMAGGFIDPAETATVKKMANTATHHTLGEANYAGKSIDLILCTPDFAPLTHRIMVRNPYLMHATDHTPEYVDLAFAD